MAAGLMSPPGRNLRGWLSTTSKLREEKPDLVGEDILDSLARDSIWKTLTMSLQPKEITKSEAESCFKSLCQPIGRGTIEDVSLIQWIDDNAWFKIGKWTLREWSQVERSGFERLLVRALSYLAGDWLHYFRRERGLNPKTSGRGGLMLKLLIPLLELFIEP
jgi:hypothetical protein